MKVFSKAVLILALFTLVACNKGFQNSTEAVSAVTNTGQTNSGDSSNAGNVDQGLANLDYQGLASKDILLTSAKQDKVLLEIDRVNQALIMILPVPAIVLTLLPLVQQEIPDLPGAKLIPYNNNTELAVSIPLKYIVRNAQFKSEQFTNTLPNGDKLPAFPAGEGAGFALAITGKYILNVYVGVSAAAVFVETPKLDSYLDYCKDLPVCPVLGPFDIRNKAKTQVLGYVALVAAKSTFSSGVFISAVFPDALARFIDDHIKY